MNRKRFLKSIALGTAAVGSGSFLTARSEPSLSTRKKKKAVLKIAHITDVHVKPQENSVERFKKCLEEVKGHKIDFVLNGGDSVNAVDYDYITREKTLELWGLWDDCIRILDGYEIYSCLGNHDTWWAAPDKSDPMYGKPYAVKRLKIPHRYYSFSKSGWHFIVLDGNNEKEFSLDQEQFDWLVKDLENRPQDTPTLIMSHYTILGVTPHLVGGMHADFKKLKELFYQHRDKVKICLSGHNHLFDHCEYNGVQYCCNGAMSGYWWEKGDKESAGPYYYQETPPGYAILTLFDDGTVENRYIPHKF